MWKMENGIFKYMLAKGKRKLKKEKKGVYIQMLKARKQICENEIICKSYERYEKRKFEDMFAKFVQNVKG